MSPLKSEPLRFRGVAALLGSFAAFLGALGLLGWLTGLRFFASILPAYVPMAPDTAVLFGALGLMLALKVSRPKLERNKLFLLLIAASSVYGLLKCIEYFAKTDLMFENSLFPIVERIGSFPPGRMSPVAGALFFLTASALLIERNHPRRSLLNWMAGAGLGVALVGFIATTGYLFGTPLLYGSGIIPLAATTSLAFLALGCGLIAAAGPETLVVRPLVGPSILARLLRIFLPLTAAIVLVQGFLDEIVSVFLDVNRALLSAVFTLIFMIVAAVSVNLVARVISRTVERAEAKLRRAEEMSRAILDAAPDAMVIVNGDGKIQVVNVQTEKMFGYTRAELLGQGIEKIIPERFRESHVIYRADYVPQAQVRAMGDGRDLYVLRKDNSEFPVEISLSPLETDRGLLVTVAIRDITERKLAEKKLQYLSTHDALTELYNRTFFEEEIARLEHSRRFPVSVVIVDLNGLKQVNDLQGHAAGDALLRRAAEVFRAAFRAEDMVARIGGDEFAVFLPNTDEQAVVHTLERVDRMLIAKNNEPNQMPLSFARGAATAQRNESLAQAMLDADKRMYADKQKHAMSRSGSIPKILDQEA